MPDLGPEGFDRVIREEVAAARERLSYVERWIAEGFYGLAAGACEGAAAHFSEAGAAAQERDLRRELSAAASNQNEVNRA